MCSSLELTQKEQLERRTVGFEFFRFSFYGASMCKSGFKSSSLACTEYGANFVRYEPRESIYENIMYKTKNIVSCIDGSRHALWKYIEGKKFPYKIHSSFMPKNYCVLKLAAFLLEVDDEKCIVSNISGYIFQIVTYLFMKREVQ